MNEVLVAVIVFIVSFLLGSIPFGLIISKLFYRKDIREHGSGNIGTTNALRTLGKVGGGAVFVLDFLKGFCSGFLAMGACWYLMPGGGLSSDRVIDYWAILGFAFLGCTLGHIFSPWLKFKGGKGIAVAVGCFFVTLGPLAAIIALAIFGVLVVLTRYVSIGSIVAALSCPFLALWFVPGHWLAIVLCSVTGLVITFAHRDNILRLANGTENRIGGKKKEQS
ncbi:MAG: glycerol-3-phosphate 1-O-acyltransferase PlsY [Coriobacteriales bacterium]|jgi:glycerol-3-phosphate acyltransferase PlsY|nr:glycerol-3-phosphate 1-O-acyltransferase PlsY [Coriobacteriales bacterium]